jgi:WD40 repeat protein
VKKTFITQAGSMSHPLNTPDIVWRLDLGQYKTEATCLTALKDGRLAATDACRVQIIDMKTGTREHLLGEHTCLIWSIVELSNGYIASSSDGLIIVWNVTTGNEEARLHAGDAGSLRVTQLHDGRLAAGADNAINIFDLTTKTKSRCFLDAKAELEIVREMYPEHNFEHPEREFSVSSVQALPGAHLAAVCVRGNEPSWFYVWDTISGHVAKRFSSEPQDWREHNARVEHIATLPDGQLISSHSDQTIRSWDLTTGKIAHSINARMVPTQFQINRGYSNSFYRFCILPGVRIAVPYPRGVIKIWNWATGEELASWRAHWGDVMSLAVTDEGHLVSSNHDTRGSEITVWNIGKMR